MTTELTAFRAALESLAVDEGRYRVVCARTGVSPVPADGRRFPDRETAVRAARLTRAYRRELRRRDPAAPDYALVVEDERRGPAPAGDDCEGSGASPATPVWGGTGADAERPHTADGGRR